MNMLLTTTGFFALTGLCVLWHLHRQTPASGRQAAVAAGPACPRCAAPVPAQATSCPGCGVPQQIYEVVAAPIRDTAPADAPQDATHAVVRADMCVGCGTCVEACPEDGAIALRGKLAVVDRRRCVGHGSCAEACPVSAIMLTQGEAVHRVRVPDIKPDFQSNIAGIFIAGELGGRGLIKNAINEGRIAAEHVAQDLAAMRSVTDAAAPTGEPAAGEILDLAIVGSGPAGLSAGLEAHRRELKYIVLEQGTLADTIRKYPRRKILFAEPLKIPLYGDLWISDSSKETLLETWETIIANTGLRVATGHRVESIIRDEDAFVLSAGGRTFRARRIILAMGRRGTPRRLDIPGEEAENVFYDIVEMEAFKSRRVTVVGGGDSAIESALGLANQPGTKVTLSYRGDTFKRVKARNLQKLKACVDCGRINLCLASELQEIRPDSVILQMKGTSKELPNDDVIIRIGGEPPDAFLGKLGVRMVQKDVPLPHGKSDISG